MNLDLSGKQALVIGSTAGIGFAAALGLTRLGASVTVNRRTQERVNEAIRKIEFAVQGATIFGVAAGLTTADGVTQMIAIKPKIDVLVNSLSIFSTKPFAEIDDAEWQRFFDTNVMSGVRLTRHYLPGMLERDWGRIVFVSSESGINIQRNDSLRRYQNRSTDCFVWCGRNDRRHRCYLQRGAARADLARRRGRLHRADGRRKRRGRKGREA